MYVRRDYSRPLFSSRRRSGIGGRFLFFYGLLIGGFLVFVYSQFGRLQLMALDAVGLAPTATPFASTFAQQGYDFFLQGRLEEAAAAYAQAVSQQPENINYLYEYGRTLIELNRGAATDQSRPISDADLASQLGDQAITAAPNDVRSYALKARALVWLDDSESAIPIALRGLELDPNFTPLLAVLARAYATIGRYQQALDYAAQAVELNPMDADAHRSYAYALIWVGEREAAIAQLEDAININPFLTPAYFELGIQYRAAQRYEEAIATYEKVLTMQPRNPRALLRLCETYSQVGQDAQAQGYCEDALANPPSDASLLADVHKQLGMVMFRRRNYEGSIQEFNQCQALGADDIECWYILGLAHYYIGGNENCQVAWDTLNEALRRINQLPVKEPILSSTQAGLQLVTQNCVAFQGRALPTLEPTSISVTPIGG